MPAALGPLRACSLSLFLSLSLSFCHNVAAPTLHLSLQDFDTANPVIELPGVGTFNCSYEEALGSQLIFQPQADGSLGEVISTATLLTAVSNCPAPPPSAALPVPRGV